MNANALHDAAWAVIQHDPALARARRVLSIHEFRLVIERIATAMRQADKERPDPLGEALNSGDGSYRP